MFDQIRNANPDHFDTLFATRKSDQERSFVFDEVRVIDLTATREIKQFRKDETVIADREREWIPFLRVRIRNENVTAVAES